MIIETLLNVIKTALLFVIGLLPDLESIALPTGFISWFTDLTSSVAYFLPMADFFVMFGIWFFVKNFEIFRSVIFRIWDSLPFV